MVGMSLKTFFLVLLLVLYFEPISRTTFLVHYCWGQHFEVKWLHEQYEFGVVLGCEIGKDSKVMQNYSFFPLNP